MSGAISGTSSKLIFVRPAGVFVVVLVRNCEPHFLSNGFDGPEYLEYSDATIHFLSLFLIRPAGDPRTKYAKNDYNIDVVAVKNEDL
jgi:hypothetical protein